MDEIKNITEILSANGNPANLAGMQRYGIRFESAYGCSMPFLRNLAKKYKNNHPLALKLWQTRIHECRIMAFLIDDPKQVTESQAELWLKDVASWDVCDGLCSNLLRKTNFAYEKAFEWSSRESEFEKRAGFVLMATLAVHEKSKSNDVFIKFLDVIKANSGDDRNFVRKAVNWALRQIGKRNYFLYDAAKAAAEEIFAKGDKSSKWIARDALREFASETTHKVLARRKQ